MPKRALTDALVLPNSSVRVPQLGFGVWQSPPDLCVKSCLTALELGYRHIDTAQLYGNEREVGEAVRTSGLPREDIFITTKIMFPGHSVDDNYAKCCESVRRLGGGEGEGGYVDCFLVHSPGRGGREKRAEVWAALERLLEEGKARSIGVSNYGIKHIEEMREHAKTWPPHMNQIEVPTCDGPSPPSLCPCVYEREKRKHKRKRNGLDGTC